MVTALLWLSVALVVAAPALAQSDDTRARAKAAFEHGVADYDAGRYEQALQNFEEAYRLRPHPLVNVNIANCYDKLNKPLQAIEQFQQFLSSDAGSPEQRHEVTTAIERLKQQVGKILLRISPEGAGVVLDQGEVRTAPITDPIMLESGRHVLDVRLQGYKSVQRTLFIKGGTTLELTVALEAEGAASAPVLALTPSEPSEPAAPPAVESPIAPEAPAATPASEPAPERSGGLPTAAWVTGGLTLALAITATATGVIALDANKKFKRFRTERFDPTLTSNARVVAYGNARDAADRARALALTTDIVLGGAAVCAAVTIYLIASHGSRSAAASGPTATLAPVFGRDGAGLALHGMF
jgi:hypothetical protein